MIIITGASRGIGKFLLSKFINKPFDNKLIGLYNKTEPDSYQEYMQQVDITKLDEINAFVTKNTNELNNLILINCAGSNYNAFGHKADPKKWAELINVNLIGTFNMINAILPVMRNQNYGRIINISSVVAQKGVPGTSAYAASKSGLWGMSKSLAVENASKGITINNLNLGYFQIGMIDKVPGEMQEKIKSNIPVNDFGNPIEIYKSVKYLIDNEYITGSSIDVNGGLY